jgi:hypothetical protein
MKIFVRNVARNLIRVTCGTRTAAICCALSVSRKWTIRIWLILAKCIEVGCSDFPAFAGKLLAGFVAALPAA